METDRARIEVEMLPATYGDALLVRMSGGETPPVNMLIDGGLVRTYDDHLRQRLIRLGEKGEQLDLVVVTHIDADHIGGVLALMRENGSSDEPKVVPIAEVWHNGYGHLGLQGRDATEGEVLQVLSQIAAPAPEEPDPDIGARQGESLAAALTGGGYAWNASFDGEAVCAGSTAELSNGALIRILSPDVAGLKRLGVFWRRELVKMGVDLNAVLAEEFEAAFEETALNEASGEPIVEKDISQAGVPTPPATDSFKEDTSTTNRSSIAFLLEWSGMRCAFLGDAWPSVVQGALLSGEEVNVLKLSHHGARGSTSPALLSHLNARHILCSSDGSRNDHPALDTLLWVVSLQPKPVTLHFNYPNDVAQQIAAPLVRERWGHEVEIAQDAEEGLRLVLTANE